MSALRKKYLDEVRPKLQEQFGYPNVMMIPRMEKIVVNMGMGEATKDRNIIQDHVQELAVITGQKPLVCRARTSVAGFKLREGQAIGAKVTLRGKRMYDFLSRLIHIACPRIRDFRGLNSSCDGRGNYTFGLDSQEMFAEVDLDKVKRAQGMTITVVTTADSDEECRALLSLLGMPLKAHTGMRKK